MAAFSLQRVLDLKKRREEASAIRLAEARTLAEDARRSEAALSAQRQEIATQSRPATSGVTVGQLQNSTYVIERIEQHLAGAREAVRVADADVDVRLSEFTTALQERRVLDRLREKRMQAATAEEAKMDQTAMDAIALTRFVRREKHDGEGET